jgi:ribonucleoside-diphosphate reductase beta chain
MLLNFQRFGKMKGMGQIVAWSVRDETLHTESIIKLFLTFIKENPRIWTENFKRDLYEACDTIIQHEDAFIDLAFQFEGAIQGMTPIDIKSYIRFIGNRRLKQLGLEPRYDVHVNPLPWMDEILNSPELVNFFENRATEYSRASTQGSWDEVFDDMDFNMKKPS